MNERLAWTIRRVEESDSNEPIAPWQGKVIDRGDGVLRIHHFNPVTGEIDEDTNGYAIVKEFELHKTRRDAIVAYIAELIRERDRLIREADLLDEEIARVKENR